MLIALIRFLSLQPIFRLPRIVVAWVPTCIVPCEWKGKSNNSSIFYAQLLPSEYLGHTHESQFFVIGKFSRFAVAQLHSSFSAYGKLSARTEKMKLYALSVSY
jgi:hypothetical protein